MKPAKDSGHAGNLRLRNSKRIGTLSSKSLLFHENSLQMTRHTQSSLATNLEKLMATNDPQMKVQKLSHHGGVGRTLWGLGF